MSVSWLRILSLMVVSACLAAGCSSAKKIDVGGACVLSSDCNQPLACTWGKCHDACHTSADCPVGQSCITASDQSRVCQLPIEARCLYASDCLPPLTCAVDQRCRNQCQTDVDCPSGETCATTKTCAEPYQLDTNKNLVAPDGGVNGCFAGVDAVSCPAGAETCSCYPNGTCDPGLTCASHLCVNVGAGGTGGAGTGGAAGSGGVSGAGGSVSSNPDAAVDLPADAPISSAGGASGGTGGIAGAGGAAGGARLRMILPLDSNWLFNKGDAAQAYAAIFADSTWRKVNLPHDWAIDGPFDQSAATTGRGGYAPSGIAWYRNHFTLPTAVTSGQQVYVEFDGVMGNSTVYVNGTQLGNHPYGYVSFRYDMTKNTKFGAENVIAVKTDTSTQPASDFYAGAGIYRHVRIIATDPVHIDQYATYVTTPSPTAAAATVHVTTSVVNSGTASQRVTPGLRVLSPSGTVVATMSPAAQSIAAGASAIFTFDTPVVNPQLWDLATPNMHQAIISVVVGGKTVDDDVTPFGIRDLKFNAGMTLNGKSLKFQGVALHQDYHGLGLAAPQRAMQRRLAQLKTIGVNAIRTANEPPSPEFLDLCDRMGFLVLDEFTDVWQQNKNAGDYALYFNKTATTPTGMPAVPGVATGATWWQADLTGWIMRDRNHPSVALYSMGNQIPDSIATRTPILSEMISISHTLDPSRNDTQALLDPTIAGDVGGATNGLLDVWGNDLDVAACTTAETTAPTKSGLLTRMDSSSAASTWASIASTPALTGGFIWTGVDYLGGVDGQIGVIGGTGSLMDAMGAINPDGNTWQAEWGVPKTTFAPPAAAGKVILTADHSTLVTDTNDVVFFQAAITGTAATPITFSITGPGTITAVDSGSMGMEPFHTSTRNAYKGAAYAIVQATGAGTITVSAKATGLTDGAASVTATVGTFVPCSGTCD